MVFKDRLFAQIVEDVSEHVGRLLDDAGERNRVDDAFQAVLLCVTQCEGER